MFGFSRKQDKKTKEEAEALSAILLKSDNTRKSEQAKAAIAYCEFCIKEYEDWFEWNEAKWLLWQRVVIIGGVIATLAGVITITDAWLPESSGWRSFGWLRGVPAGLVTIAAGYLSSFTYSEDAVRQELTASALWSELAKYQAHEKPYDVDEEEATSLFINNIAKLVENETHSWNALVMGNNNDNKATKGKAIVTARTGQPNST